MEYLVEETMEIKRGLSKKKVFRKIGKELNKIIIDFSNNTDEFIDFLNVYEILKKVNISIPKIYEVNLNKKILVMEDFGKDTFDVILKEKNLYNLLKLAIDNLIIIQNSITNYNLVNLKKYTYNDLKNEIFEFVDYYLPYRGIQNFPLDTFFESWKNKYDSLKIDFNSFNHKDFEFINLIYLNKKKDHMKCGIIDFQSAFIGFKGWDLISILENPRINFTRDYNEEFIKYFYKNVNINIEYETFKDQYYFLNLGRQTRLLGRWVKLYNDGNEDCVNYIGITEKRIISFLNNLQDDNLIKIYKTIL